MSLFRQSAALPTGFEITLPFPPLLGGILGDGDRPWHPRDDRISLLVLERELRPELGWDVRLDLWWAEPWHPTRASRVGRRRYAAPAFCR